MNNEKKYWENPFASVIWQLKCLVGINHLSLLISHETTKIQLTKNNKIRHYSQWQNYFSNIKNTFMWEKTLWISILYLLLLFPSLRWAFTGVYVRASLLRSSGLFLVYSTVVELVSILHIISNSSSLFPGSWGPSQTYELDLIPPSPSCFTVFSAFWENPEIFSLLWLFWLLFNFEWVLHTSICWWFFTEVCVTASLLCSPELKLI